MIGTSIEEETLVKNVLHYGYYPDGDRTELPAGIEQATACPELKKAKTELIQEGIDALGRSFDRLVSQTPGDATHILPLSGGLDSRLILAELYHNSDIGPEQLQTVTFGTPGTWDFEIGQRVANELGVRNLAIDLTEPEFDWSWKALVEYACGRRPNKFLEGYVNLQATKHTDGKCVFWSGFMGDPTAGAHQPKHPTDSWETACEQFAVWNKAPEKKLTPPNFDPTNILPDRPFLNSDQLSYEEQLDFAIRQQYFIRPVVQSSSYNYLTPFLQDEWLSFVFRLPKKYRSERQLFKELVQEAYPQLFALPTDARYGLPLSAPNWQMQINRVGYRLIDKTMSLLGSDYTPPWTNYLNFEIAFRRWEHFRTLAENAVEYLESRNVGSYHDERQLWESHQTGQNYATELKLLISLALYLKTH